MSLRDRIQTDITAAMRSGDSLRRDVLRMASNAIYNGEKRDRRTYADDEVVAVLAREVKTRHESVDAFRSGGREDLASKEQSEIAILQGYLPQALDEVELGELVRAAITATRADSARDLGKVMGWLAPKTRGRADGRHVSEIVARALASADVAGHDVGHAAAHDGSNSGSGAGSGTPDRARG